MTDMENMNRDDIPEEENAGAAEEGAGGVDMTDEEAVEVLTDTEETGDGEPADGAGDENPPENDGDGEAAEDESGDTPAEKKESLISVLFDYLEILVFSVAAVLIIFTLAFRLCLVDGSSMRNTLYNNQMLITCSLVDPEPGDIIVFHMTSETYDHFNEPLVKRLIAVGGQTVRYDYTDKSLYVDGEKVDDSWAHYLDDAGNPVDSLYQLPNHSYNAVTKQFEVTVPEGCLFVMGDNRNHSADSRTVQVGFVDERRVLGKVVVNLGESRGCFGQNR